MEPKSPVQPAAGEREPAPRLTGTMEQEVFRLLGGVLGTLEALATDAEQPLEGRQRDRLQQALDLGHDLKDHIEALTFLAQGEACDRLTMAPYSVRRMLEHAVRSAAWQASEHGVSLTLPPLEQWSERSVRVDVRALDRVIRGACEYLIAIVSRGGRVNVTVGAAQGGLQVDLRGESLSEAIVAKPPSELLHAAWTRLIELHGGRFALHGQRLHAELWLPMSAE